MICGAEPRGQICMDTMAALLQHMRDYRDDLEQITREISAIREKSARERGRLINRLDRIDKTLEEIKTKMAEPVQFTFGAFWGATWTKVGFGLGMTLASLKLPDEAAKQLIELAGLFLGK